MVATENGDRQAFLSSSRTKCVSTKLTEAEYAMFERAAGAQTLSAWARTVLLRAATPTPPARAEGDSRDGSDPPRVDVSGNNPGDGLAPQADHRAASYARSPVCDPTAELACGPSADRSSWHPSRTANARLTGSSAWVPAMLVLACISAGGISAYRYARRWTPLQRQYLASYVWSAVAISRGGSYDLLVIVDRTERRTALDTDVVPVVPTPGGDTLALTTTAVSHGAVRLVWQRSEWDHAALHAFLRHAIYQDQTLRDLARPALWGALAMLVAALGPVISDAIARAITRRATRPAWERSARASNRAWRAWRKHPLHRHR
jgi:hypothetical protein